MERRKGEIWRLVSTEVNGKCGRMNERKDEWKMGRDERTYALKNRYPHDVEASSSVFQRVSSHL